jgi:hypothetical protein
MLDAQQSISLLHIVILIINIFIVGGVGSAIYAFAVARANDKRDKEEDRKKQEAVLSITEANKKALDTIQTNHLMHLTEATNRVATGIEKLTEITIEGNKDLAVIRYELTRPRQV